MIDPHILIQAIHAANDGIVITEYQKQCNPIVFVNNSFEEMTGYNQKEILGKDCRFLQRDDRNQKGLDVVRNAIHEGKNCRVELRNYKKNGMLFWNELSLAPLLNSQGEITHFVGIQKDITQQKRFEEALFSQVHQDPLTNLLNRRGFLNEARRAILLARRQKINLLFIMVDIDSFKYINDSYGHTAGDEILISFANLLKKNQRKSDVLARYGGDEFMLILFENEKFVYENWLERIELGLAKLNATKMIPCNYSISAGAAQLSFFELKSLIALVKEADKEMYAQKIRKKQNIAQPYLVTNGKYKNSFNQNDLNN